MTVKIEGLQAQATHEQFILDMTSIIGQDKEGLTLQDIKEREISIIND